MSAVVPNLSNSTFPSILLGVAAGDKASMQQCVSQYGGLIWSIVRKYCYNSHEAEDLAQEIFLSIWRSASKYDAQKSAEKTFIALIARRRCIDWVRKQQSLPKLESLEPEMLEKQVDSFSEPTSQGKFDLEALQAEIQDLPEETRTLFDFHFRLGLTHQQLSEKLQMPLGTVKSKLRSGILQLRSRYQSLA